MNALTPLAVSAEPLLLAIRDNPDASHKSLAEACGRGVKNIARDLDILANNGLIIRHPPRLTHAGVAALEALERARAPGGGNGVPAPGIVMLRHDEIVVGALNPRKTFDPEALGDLARGILAAGEVLQNLVVTAARADGKHELIAGERRWRAVGALIEHGEWSADRPIACRVDDADEKRHRLLALQENAQRKDLTPLEEAAAFKELVDTGVTEQEIAELVGMTRKFVQQRLDLNKLDDDDRGFLESGRMTIEEARRRANAPKAADLGLTAPELQLLGEIAHRMEHMPKRKNDWQHRTECACDAQSPELDRLVSLRVIEIAFDADGTGRRYIGRAHRWHDAMKLKPPAPGAAVYDNAFLNGPFELSIGMKARQEQKKEQRRADKVTREAENQRKRELQARIDDFLAAASSRPMNEVAAAAREILQDMGVPLPWRIEQYEGIKAGTTSVALKPWQAADPPFNLQAVLVAAAALEAKPPRLHMAGSAVAVAEDASRPVRAADVYEYNALSAGPNPGDIIFQLRVGDVVATGGAMTYRLLAPANRPASAFKVQPILKGKDHGSPRTIALSEISRVVESAS